MVLEGSLIRRRFQNAFCRRWFRHRSRSPGPHPSTSALCFGTRWLPTCTHGRRGANDNRYFKRLAETRDLGPEWFAEVTGETVRLARCAERAGQRCSL